MSSVIWRHSEQCVDGTEGTFDKLFSEMCPGMAGGHWNVCIRLEDDHFEVDHTF